MATIERTDEKNSVYNVEDDEVTEQEKSILKQFRDRLQDVLKNSHDDHFLIRFLRARKLNIERAEKMLRDHLKLRRHFSADTIAKDFQLPEIIRKYLSFNCIGRDKNGHIIFGFLVGYTDFKGISHSLTFCDQVKTAAHIIEKAMAEMEEEHAKDATKGRRFVVIFDLQGFDFRTLMNRFILKQHLQLIRMYEANYPETLYRIFLLNVPGIFHTWFNLAKRVLDEKTVNKIKFCQKGKEHTDLLEIIEADVLPAFLGGKRTDPDGNPNCISLLPRSGKVPKACYLNPSNLFLNLDDTKFCEVTIAARSFLDVSVEVKEPDSLLRWNFYTQYYNIRYGVHFADNKETAATHVNKKVLRSNVKDWAVPLETADSHIAPVEWQICCEKTGTYIIHFDNTYSWMKPKELRYKVEVISPVKLQSYNSHISLNEI